MVQKNSKAQAGLEYLVTYGWALILITVVIGVLVFILSSPASTVTFSSSDPTKILMKVGNVTGTTTEIKMQNITGGRIEITSVSMPSGYSPPDCSLNDTTDTSLITSSNPVQVMAGGEIFIECANISDTSGTISIDYTDYSNLQRNVDITASGTAGGIGGLVAYYKFDEGSDTSTADSSGNENHGTLLPVGSEPTWQTTGCPSGNCLLFDGVDDYVDCGNTESLSISSAGTISVWFYKTGTMNYPHLVCKQNFKGSPRYGYDFRTDNHARDHKMILGLADDSNHQIAQADTALNLNQWYHGAVTWDGSNIKFYLDGTPDGTANQWITPISNVYNLFIGYTPTFVGWHTGLIDSVKIYNKALNATEICSVCKEHIPAGGACNCA